MIGSTILTITWLVSLPQAAGRGPRGDDIHNHAGAGVLCGLGSAAQGAPPPRGHLDNAGGGGARQQVAGRRGSPPNRLTPVAKFGPRRSEWRVVVHFRGHIESTDHSRVSLPPTPPNKRGCVKGSLPSSPLSVPVRINFRLASPKPDTFILCLVHLRSIT